MNNNYAGFWIRFAAYIADALILFIPDYIITEIIRSQFNPINTDQEALVELYALAISLLLWWVYCAGFNSSALQGTPGKKLCSLKVVDNSGNRISFGKASLRYFSSLLSACILIIGYLMVIWTDKKQALHDMIAGTFVVKV